MTEKTLTTPDQIMKWPALSDEEISSVMKTMRVCNRNNVLKWWDAFRIAIQIYNEKNDV